MPRVADAGRYVPSVRPDLAQIRVDNEAIIWSPLRPEPTYLDPVAALMLGVIDGKADAETLMVDVHEGLGVDPDIARDQVMRVLYLLDLAGALDSSFPHDEPWSESAMLFDPPDV